MEVEEDEEKEMEEENWKRSVTNKSDPKRLLSYISKCWCLCLNCLNSYFLVSLFKG